MRGALVLAVLFPAALLAGCAQSGISDDYRPRHVRLKQVDDGPEGVATFQLQSRAPDLTPEVLLLSVNETVLERAPSCPPPPGAWAWCGDAAFRAGDLLQVRAEPGSVLRIAEGPPNNVLMTYAVR